MMAQYTCSLCRQTGDNYFLRLHTSIDRNTGSIQSSVIDRNSSGQLRTVRHPFDLKHCHQNWTKELA